MKKDRGSSSSALSELLPRPDIFSAKRILCVQPHPDDADIACGGTIARLVAQGTEVIYLTVTDDVSGFTDRGLSVRRRRLIRREEQTLAGKCLGVNEFFWLDFRDAGDWNIRTVRNRVISVIRRLCPDFILTSDPWLPHEAHQDHVKAGLAACEAAILCDLPYIGRARFTACTPADLKGVGLFFTSEPNTYIDYSDFQEQKYRSITAHRSQFNEDERILLFQYDEVRGRALGRQHGLRLAEGLYVLHTRELHAFPSLGRYE